MVLYFGRKAIPAMNVHEKPVVNIMTVNFMPVYSLNVPTR